MKRKRPTRSLAGLFALLLLALGILSGCAGSRTPTPFVVPTSAHIHEDAWFACIRFIQTEKHVPALEAQQYQPNAVVELGPDHYRAIIFYARREAAYLCDMTYSAAGWHLQRLDIAQ